MRHVPFHSTIRLNFVCHVSFGTTVKERAQLDENTRHYYETTMSEWLAVEAIVRQRDKEKTAHAVAKLSSESSEHHKAKTLDNDAEIENDVFEENAFSDLSDPEVFDEEQSDQQTTGACPVAEKPSRVNKSSTDSGNVPDEEGDAKGAEDAAEVKDSADAAAEEETSVARDAAELSPESVAAADDDDDEENDENIDSNKSSPSESSYETVANDFVDLVDPAATDFGESDDYVEENANSPSAVGRHAAVIITDASVDIVNLQSESPRKEADGNNGNDTLSPLHEEANGQTSLDALQEPKSACVSPASSNGGIYSVICLENKYFIENLHY